MSRTKDYYWDEINALPETPDPDYEQWLEEETLKLEAPENDDD